MKHHGSRICAFRRRAGSALAAIVALMLGSTGGSVDDEPALRLVVDPSGSWAFRDSEDRQVGELAAAETADVEVATAPPQLPGWPLVTGEVESTPTVADLDGDGRLEVVFSSLDRNLYAVREDGSALPGWPIFVDRSASTPALVDTDGDGTLEIFIGAGNKLYGLHHDGGVMAGWPKEGDRVFASPAVGDLDSDGDWEVTTGDEGTAFLWDVSGAPKAGWPFEFPQYFDIVGDAPGLGDVDGDGVTELVFPMFAIPSFYIFSLDGRILPGFPLSYEFGVGSGVSLADIDEDGDQEMWFHESNAVWVVDGAARTVEGWPRQRGPIANAAPAIGDLDGDGQLEMVFATIGGDAKVFAYNHDGTRVNGWPETVPGFSFNSQAALGDVDGDGGVDVVIGGFTAGFSTVGRIYAWHADSTLVDGFPFAVPEGKSILLSSITITDLDQDGDVELLVGSITGIGGTGSGRVFAFDLDAPYDPKTMEWPTKGHDIRNTNRYEPLEHKPVASAGADFEVECTGAAATPVTLDASASQDEDSTPGTNDDIVSFEWFEDFGLPTETFLGTGEVLVVDLPLGPHALTLRATDRTGREGTDEVSVTVVDTTPPELTIVLTPAELWPPNHRMVEVEAEVSLLDACGAASLLLLTGVASSEPDDLPGDGDGETVDDIQGVELLTADTTFRLRAERSGDGPGRTYSVTYSASDGFQPVTGTVDVRVPHDAGGGAEPLLLELRETSLGTLVSWAEVAGARSYGVIRGDLGNLQDTGVGFDLGPVLCVGGATATTSTAGSEDAEVPAPGGAFFYLAEYVAEAPSGYGTGSAARERVLSAGEGCP